MSLFFNQHKQYIPIVCILGQSNAVGSFTGVPFYNYLAAPISNAKIYFDDEWQTLDYPDNNYAHSGVSHGPELSIGYFSSKSIYIFKLALGGTSITEGESTPSWDPNEVGGLFDDAVNGLLAANSLLINANYIPYIAGVFWSQWEADNADVNYGAKLTNFISSFRTAISAIRGSDAFEFVISRASKNATAYLAANILSIQSQQDYVAANVPNVKVINTDNITKYPITTDNIHYLSFAHVNLGIDFLNEIGLYTTSTDFIFTVKTTAINQTFTLPTISGETYDSLVTWGDGGTSTITAYDDADRIHTFASAGNWQVRISGKFGGWSFNNGGDKAKITSIDNWGNVGFDNLISAFYGCSELLYVTPNPLINHNCTNFSNFFRNCLKLKELHLANWNVSGVTQLPLFVSNCNTMTILDVSNWNTSDFINLISFAQACSSLLSIDVSNWDISNVTSVYRFLYNAAALVSFDTSNWNTDSLTDCRDMCYGCIVLTSVFLAELWWSRNPAFANFSNCFTDDINIANYAAIPNNWKGL